MSIARCSIAMHTNFIFASVYYSIEKTLPYFTVTCNLSHLIVLHDFIDLQLEHPVIVTITTNVLYRYRVFQNNLFMFISFLLSPTFPKQ